MRGEEVRDDGGEEAREENVREKGENVREKGENVRENGENVREGGGEETGEEREKDGEHLREGGGEERGGEGRDCNEDEGVCSPARDARFVSPVPATPIDFIEEVSQ